MKIKIKTTKDFIKSATRSSFVNWRVIYALIAFPILFMFSPGLFGEMASEEPWLFPVIGVVLVICITNHIVNVMQNKEIKEYSEINFNEYGVGFKRNSGKKNTEFYPYESIKSLKIEFKTEEAVDNRTGTDAIGINRIDLVFALNNEKDITINLYGDIRYVYKILDYKKYFKEFDYNFNTLYGCEEIIRAIDFYTAHGSENRNKYALSVIVATTPLIFSAIVLFSSENIARILSYIFSIKVSPILPYIALAIFIPSLIATIIALRNWFAEEIKAP